MVAFLKTGVLAWLVLTLAGPRLAAAAAGEQIRGTVARDGAAIAGVTVLVHETGAAAITGRDGRYVLGVPAGVYTLTAALGAHALTRSGVRVDPGATAVVDFAVTWDIGFAEAITVESASRRPERVIDAPAAVSTVPRDTLDLGAAAGQLPRLVRGTVGVEAPQNSLYDFNVNTRGVNAFLSRRVQVVIDGRDPDNPATSAPEWWNLELLSDDIESMEIARGPSAALYGPNSFNGVLTIVTRRPRDSPGGLARVTAGTRETLKLQGRWAGPVAEGWHVRLLGHHTLSDDFTVARDRTVEYPGLQREAVSLSPERLHVTAGAVRADRHFDRGPVLTLEGGAADGAGAVFMTAASRGQQQDTLWTWGRANYRTAAWNLSASVNHRSGDAVLLSTGALLATSGTAYAAEAQSHRFWRGGRTRLVAGAAYTRRAIDSADDRGAQTLFSAPVTSDQGAVFGQVDHDLVPDVKLVAAARYDASTLHDAQVSPKLAVVYGPAPGHRLRIGYNQAFQVATYTELYVDVPAAPPLDLSVLEAALAPLAGRPLGFDAVPVRVAGNRGLDVEQVKAVEAGYSGVVGRHLLVGADYYYNRMRDFISGFLPGVNPAFPAYRAPAGVPAQVAAIIESTVAPLLPGLTNDATGRPAIVLSPGNFGSVRTQGAEASLSVFAGAAWRADASYTWFDFDVREAPAAAPIFANAPRHTVKAGGGYSSARLLARLDARWVDGFFWSSGTFAGPVPSYGVVDLSARYQLARRWQVGTSIANLLDNEHYEVFGGNLLRRFSLVYTAVTF